MSRFPSHLPSSSPATANKRTCLSHRASLAQLQTPIRKISMAPQPFPSARKSCKSSVRKLVRREKEEPVKVAIRIRPIDDNQHNYSRAFEASSANTSIIETFHSSKPLATPRRKELNKEVNEYYFDNVFKEESTTHQIYTEFVQDIVSSVAKDGINGAIFTYGQTGSGKTFTMQGNDADGGACGIVQLAAKDIFNSINSELSGTECSVKVSYLEIYNEELRDLLASDPTSACTPLAIYGNCVKDLSHVTVGSFEQLMEVFRKGSSKKAVGSTKMNLRSSRSHTVLKIAIDKKTTTKTWDDWNDGKENVKVACPNKGNNSSVTITTSILNLVDLAGSESARLTGATGLQKEEGGWINKSLLTLSEVCKKLGQKNPGHINYRDSKLTHILKPSLSESGQVAFICCISPSSQYIEVTRSTLQFAKGAKRIHTWAVANDALVRIDSSSMAAIRLEVEELKLASKSMSTAFEEIFALKEELLHLKAEQSKLTQEHSKLMQEHSILKEEHATSKEECSLLKVKVASLENNAKRVSSMPNTMF
eukprot:CCRYP_001575-RB/>CCRYP_001575-RB protein AED:0.04 eAED:0.04 QI:311/1/1/1/1/0.75/4/744/535